MNDRVKKLEEALRHLVAVTTPDANGQIGAQEEHRAALDTARDTLSEQAAPCAKCGGSGLVDDGEIDCYPDGEPFENGPVKCVKDCPACATRKLDAAPTQDERELCPSCQGSGSGGGRMHCNAAGDSEYEAFRCENCDGFGWNIARPAQTEQPPAAECTSEDRWNCKYCRKGETCAALKDERNFGSPMKAAPEPEQGGLVEALREILNASDLDRAQAVANRALGCHWSAPASTAPQPVVVPEGWRLVPTEPTAIMREAFHLSYARYEDGRGECPDSQWKAMLRYAPAAPITQTAQQHPDDEAVDRFAAAMKVKLAAGRAKGRTGWDDPNVVSVEYLAEQLVEHLGKGNAGTFEDIGAFAMMLHQRDADPEMLAGVLGCVLPDLLPQDIQQLRGALQLAYPFVREARTREARRRLHLIDKALKGVPQPEQSRLLEALEQYADDSNWCYDTCSISRDIAKNALAAYRAALSAKGAAHE